MLFSTQLIEIIDDNRNKHVRDQENRYENKEK